VWSLKKISTFSEEAIDQRLFQPVSPAVDQIEG
jgi:hypothetical protein